MRNSFLVFGILVLFVVTFFYCAKSEKPESEEIPGQIEEAVIDTTAAPEEAEEMGSGDDPIEIIYPDKNDTTG